MNFESATTPSTKNDLPDENDVDSGFVANFASSSDRPEPESVFESFGAPFGATNHDFSQESTEQARTTPIPIDYYITSLENDTAKGKAIKTGRNRAINQS